MHERVKRIGPLEDQFRYGGRQYRTLLVGCQRGWTLAGNRCIEILGHCGCLPGRQLGFVSLLDIEEGLNSEGSLETGCGDMRDRGTTMPGPLCMRLHRAPERAMPCR